MKNEGLVEPPHCVWNRRTACRAAAVRCRAAAVRQPYVSCPFGLASFRSPVPLRASERRRLGNPTRECGVGRYMSRGGWRGCAQSDEDVRRAAHAEPARGATAVYSGGHAERQERAVSRGTCHARCRAAGIEVSHGIAYGECRLRPSLIALLHDPVGTHRMLYELRAGWCMACVAAVIAHRTPP